MIQDVWGNPTLVLENEIYRVTLLHDDYTVSVGEKIDLGDPFGLKSNRGYTIGWDGAPFWERPGCGYPTHLNVFDKRLGDNVDPWGLINK